MPIAVAIAIRYIIMAAVQLGLWSLIEKYGIPLINNAITSIMQVFGMSEEDAKAVMANKIIIAFEEVGIFAATLRTKMPIKVAEYLGFTSKGYTLRKVSSKAATTVEKISISATSKAVATAAEIDLISNSVAKSRGVSLKSVVSLWKFITNNVAASAVVVLTLAQVQDFANWQGAYQKTYQKIFTFFGFPPDSPMPKARTLSTDTWTRIYATVEVLNPIGISFPFSGVDKPYSRNNLADMIDELAANLVKNGTQATYKNVIALALPLIQLNGEPDTRKLDALNFSPVGSSSSSSSSKSTSIPTTKVFTGVISQGVVGAGLSFTPRPDDLIESLAELREAAANNLAPYLAALPAKIVYEVKVVSSIVTADGFRQRGTTQRIQTGTYANGNPKYKTITNKFATLLLYALTDKGSRAKLSTIVLGPVNSATLVVNSNDLQSLQDELPKIVTTSDISEIRTIATPAQVEIKDTNIVEVKEIPYTLYEIIIPTDITNFNIENAKKQLKDLQAKLNTDPQIVEWRSEIASGTAKFNTPTNLKDKEDGIKEDIEIWRKKLQQYVDSFLNNNPQAKAKYGASVPATVSAVSSPERDSVKTGSDAATLNQWYQAQGQSLPSVAERSALYEGLGLGPKTYYFGTAEQNTKLLNALKAK